MQLARTEAAGDYCHFQPAPGLDRAEPLESVVDHGRALSLDTLPPPPRGGDYPVWSPSARAVRSRAGRRRGRVLPPRTRSGAPGHAPETARRRAATSGSDRTFGRSDQAQLDPLPPIVCGLLARHRSRPPGISALMRGVRARGDQAHGRASRRRLVADPRLADAVLSLKRAPRAETSSWTRCTATPTAGLGLTGFGEPAAAAIVSLEP
jgi:hypothetical protein